MSLPTELLNKLVIRTNFIVQTPTLTYEGVIEFSSKSLDNWREECVENAERTEKEHRKLTENPTGCNGALRLCNRCVSFNFFELERWIFSMNYLEFMVIM
jgi:hypothetical protein